MAPPEEARLSSEMIMQLRAALKIKNLTAIKALARQAMDNPTSRRTGEQIEACASGFDFQRLSELLSELEAHRD